MPAPAGAPLNVAVERDGREWCVWVLLDVWPHRRLVRKFHTRRSAEAAGRIRRTGVVNVSDARTIISDDAARASKVYPARGQSHWRDACESFVMTWALNGGCAFDGGRAAFDALVAERP